MKRAAQFSIRMLDKTIGILVLTVFMIVLAGVIYFSTVNSTLIGEADSGQYQIYKPSSGNEMQLDELRRINPEVIGWITVDDTPVDYPVVQADNNSKYINTSVLGEFALSGALFLDSRNDPGYTDTLSVIYGHNMSGSVMFGDFYLYEDEAYYDSHRTGALFFDGTYHELRIFAYLEADGYDREVYHLGLKEEDRAAWLDMIRKRAIYFSEDISEDKPLLMLSTCMAGDTNGRTLLLAEIGDVKHFIVSGETNRSETQPVTARNAEEKFPYGVLIGAAAGLLVLTAGYIVWTYKRKERTRDGAE